jgi:peptidoglycan/LPS O-acetylase OafA/YrhL
MNLGTCHAGGCSFPRDFFANHLILLFGLGASIAYCSKRSVPMRRPILVAALAAALFIGYGTFEAVMGTGVLPVDRRLVYGLLSGLLIFALVRSEDTGQLRIQNRWMPLLGDASYALYLIHYPLISALCKLSILVGLHGRVGALIAYPLIICACIAAAVAFQVLIERRILRVLSTRKSAPALAHGVP